MNSVLKQSLEFLKNSISFLHDVSTLPEIDVPALKSFYSTKRRLMELRSSILLPSSCTRTSITCQRCLINLKDGPATYRVVAAKRQSGFAKKLLRKQQSGKPLTRYQQKYMGKLNSFTGNHLAITCKFCNNESLIKMEKPKKFKHKINIVKSKKKKKKDKFCGLNKDIVSSVTSNAKKKILGDTASGKSLKKKKIKLNQDSLEVVSSLTPQNIRCLDNGKTEDKKLRLKLKKVKEIKVCDISKENLKKSKHKSKKKKQSLNRLGEILFKADTLKKPVANLKQFLQVL